jgi:hypothetical protein
MTSIFHHAQLFSIEMESHKIFPGLAFNHDPLFSGSQPPK